MQFLPITYITYSLGYYGNLRLLCAYDTFRGLTLSR